MVEENKQVFETKQGLTITVELLDDYCKGERRRYVIFIDPEPDSECSYASITKRSDYVEVKLEITRVYTKDDIYICRDGIHDEAPEM